MEKSMMRQMIEVYRKNQCNVTKTSQHSIATWSAVQVLEKVNVKIVTLSGSLSIDANLSTTKTSPEDGREISGFQLPGFLLPKELRDEWRGDFSEAMQELKNEGYSRWARGAVALGRVFLLGIALIRIRLQDLVSLGKKKRPL